MLGIGAAGHDVDVVVRAARLARIEAHRRVVARPAPWRRRVRPACRSAPGWRSWCACSACIASCIATCSRRPSPVRWRLNRAPRMVIAISMPVPVSPSEMPGSGRRAVRIAGDADRAAAGLRDHVEGEVFLVRAALAEAFDLAVDDAGVQLLAPRRSRGRGARSYRGRSSRRVTSALRSMSLTSGEPARGFQIHRERLLVGVEDVKVIGVGRRACRAGGGGRDRPSSGSRSSPPRRRSRRGPRCRRGRLRTG